MLLACSNLRISTFQLNNKINAITIIMAFSIKVASVIGRFKVVPRQAHVIDFLSKSALVTPIVVIPKIAIVRISAKNYISLK